MHPSDGTLRRSLDEPVAIDAANREHVATLRAMRRAGAAHRAQTPARSGRCCTRPSPGVDMAAARARLAQTRVAAATDERAGAHGRARSAERATASNRLSPVSASRLGASVVLVVSGGAQDFLSLFQPSQLAAVPVTASDVRSLAGLASYGTVSGGAVDHLRA